MSMPTTHPNAREALKRRILDLLDARGQPMTVWEIAGKLYPSTLSENTVRRALRDLIVTGEVHCERGEGREAATYRTETEGD